MKSRDPITPGEWQDAADAAEVFLTLDSARKYGLVTGGPVVDVDRAADLLSRAKALGIQPSKDAVERLVKEIAR